MYEPPSDNLDPNSKSTSEPADPISSAIERAEAENLSVKSVLARQEQLKRLFAWLIGIGVGLGILVAIAIIIAIQKLGLAKKPYEIEAEENQPIQVEEVQPEKKESSESSE